MQSEKSNTWLYRGLRRVAAWVLLLVLGASAPGLPAAGAHAAPAPTPQAAPQAAEQEHADSQHAEASSEGEGDESFSAIEHTIDANYLDFPPAGIVELPRLFLLKEADGSWGLDGYWSTRQALRSGKYGLRHETGAGAQELVTDRRTIGEMIAGEKHLHGGLAALGGAHVVVDFSMTKHLFYALLAGLLVLGLCIALARRYQRGIGRETAPRGIVQNAVESAVVFVRDDIAEPAIGEGYRKFMPFLLTAFFFILLGNVFALIPYTSAPTANISVTLALAFFTFIIGQIYASKAHWKELFTGPPGVPVLIRVILVPIEIVGLLVRHLALAIRLFANMMAGTMVVFSLIGLIFLVNQLFGATVAWLSVPVSIGLTLFILGIKLLVAVIQAYVFTVLSAIFIGMAIEEHGGMEEEGPDAPVASETGTSTPAVGSDGIALEDRQRRTEQPVPAAG